jgi:pyruvate dehydrogenase E1 component
MHLLNPLIARAGTRSRHRPRETAEWREALLTLIGTQGPDRARQILDELANVARKQRTGWQPELNTPYMNTIAVDDQPVFPGDLATEERLVAIMRWNALAMVVRANQAYGELGGHIASYASVADLFETGFHHFFHARTAQHQGDLVFFSRTVHQGSMPALFWKAA